MDIATVDVNRFQNRQYKVLVSFSALNKTKGVLILTRRKLNLSLKSSGSDCENRFCYAIVTHNNSKICLASIYAPNVFNSDFFESIKSTLLSFPDATLILAGDFNLLVDPDMDSLSSVSASKRASSAYIKSFLRDLNIVDIWRI